MFKTVARLTTILLLAAGLAVGESHANQQETAATPIVSPPANSTVTPFRVVCLRSDEMQVSLLKGRVTLMIPAGFGNKWRNMGRGNGDDNQFLRFTNVANKQVVNLSAYRHPGTGLADTRDRYLNSITIGLLIGFSRHYQDIKKVGQQDLTIDSQKFRRFDTTQQLQGKDVLASVVLTILDGQVILIQVESPADDAAGHDTTVSSIIDSIKINSLNP